MSQHFAKKWFYKQPLLKKVKTKAINSKLWQNFISNMYCWTVSKSYLSSTYTMLVFLVADFLNSIWDFFMILMLIWQKRGKKQEKKQEKKFTHEMMMHWGKRKSISRSVLKQNVMLEFKDRLWLSCCRGDQYLFCTPHVHITYTTLSIGGYIV